MRNLILFFFLLGTAAQARSLNNTSGETITGLTLAGCSSTEQKLMPHQPPQGTLCYKIRSPEAQISGLGIDFSYIFGEVELEIQTKPNLTVIRAHDSRLDPSEGRLYLREVNFPFRGAAIFDLTTGVLRRF